MSIPDNIPSDETPTPENAPNQQDFQPDSPHLPLKPLPASPEKSQGVTGLLREIFRRNASSSNMGSEEEAELELPNDSDGSQAVGMGSNLDDILGLTEENQTKSPFLEDNSLPDPLSGRKFQSGQDDQDAAQEPKDTGSSQISSEQNPQDGSDLPNKGGFKSILTGVLRNTGVLHEPRTDSAHEEAIDERLSNIFPSNSEKPAEQTWEEKFLESLSAAQESQDNPDDLRSGFYDPNDKYFKGSTNEEDEEVDYLFQEWIGYTKSPKNKADIQPVNNPISQEPEEKEPFLQLPALSMFEEDEEALFEEQNNNFKEKNSFLYTPNQNQEAISLDEMRKVVLEEVQNETGESNRRRKHVSVDKSSRSFHNLSRLEIIALAFVGILILAIGVTIPYILSHPAPQATPIVNAPPPPIQDVAPSPVGIRITGGWYFPLSKNNIVDGRWTPKGPEWLEGSDIRRIVALPWNKQLEAAIKTLLPGDEIDINFNNNEHIVYQVDKVVQVASDQTNIGSETISSLLVILYDQNSSNRWVILCYPLSK